MDYKVSFEILPTYSEMNGKMAIYRRSNNVNKHTGHELLAVLNEIAPPNKVRFS